MSDIERPLEGIRVLDLTSVVVGPVCTLRLADYGADIVKVEPVEGDLLRALGGPSPDGQHSGPFMQLNRAKRSCALDLKHELAAPLIACLLDSSDVVVANMRPDALARLGLDAASARRTRPRLVHCTITGYGPGGSYTGRPAYDSVVQGVAGVAGLTALKGGDPHYAPLLLCDHVTGEIAAGAVLSALLARERTGIGSAIEVPMFETMAAFVLQEHLGPASFAPPLAPPGDRRVLSPGNRPVQTADGWLSLTTNTDKQSVALLRCIGREDLIHDERFATVSARIRNIDAWLTLRNEAIRYRGTTEWIAVLTEADIPCMPCHDLDGLMGDTHLGDVGLLGSSEHPTVGRVVQLRPTILTDGVAAPTGPAAPPLGWHTREVLRELGIDAAAIDAAAAAGAILEGQDDC